MAYRLVDKQTAKLDVKASPELERTIQDVARARFEGNFSQAVRWLIGLGLGTPEAQAELAKAAPPTN